MNKKITSILIVAGMFSMGCAVCEDLDARVCEDLGPEDCALLKEREQNPSAQVRSGRTRRGWMKELLYGPNGDECRTLGSDAAYPQYLEGLKGMLASMRSAEAAQAEREARGASMKAAATERVEAARARAEAAKAKAEAARAARAAAAEESAE